MMTKHEFGDKLRAIRGMRWCFNLRGICRSVKFILWDVWTGGF